MALWLALLFGAWTARAAAQAPEGGQDTVEFEQSAYRVRLVLATDRHPFFTEARREGVERLLSAHFRRVVGECWQLTIEPSPEWLPEGTAEEIEQLDGELIRRQADGYDKLFLLGVVFTVNGLELAGREHDTATDHTGPVFTSHVATSDTLVHGMLRLCLRLFSPLARLERAESRRVLLTLKGGRLRLNDPDLQWAGPGRPFAAFRRFFRRDGQPPEVSVVPWSFVEVDQVQGAAVEAAIRSRLRRPFTRRTDRRNDLLALGLATTGRPTRVRFLDDAHQTSLVGYTAVIQTTREPIQSASVSTDRSGTVVVRPQDEGLSLIVLRQGDRSVAFLYLVPGQEREITATLDAGEDVLALSSELKALEAEFVDLVAQRAILVQSIERHLAKAELAEADRLLARLRALPTEVEFQRKLSAFLANSQSQTGGKFSKTFDSRIAEMRSQIGSYLDGARIGSVSREIERVRLEAARNQGARRSSTDEDPS